MQRMEKWQESPTPADLGAWLASAEKLPAYINDQDLVDILRIGKRKRAKTDQCLNSVLRNRTSEKRLRFS